MNLFEHKPSNIFHGPEGAESNPDYAALEEGAQAALNELEKVAGPTAVARSGVEVDTEVPDLGSAETGTNPPEWLTDYMASQEQAADQPNDQRVTEVNLPETTISVGDETPTSQISVVGVDGKTLPLDKESLQTIADTNAPRLRVTTTDGAIYSLIRLGNNSNNWRAQKLV